MLYPDGPTGRAVISASDLRAASVCEYSLLREADARLGRRERVEETADQMLERVAALGLSHEQRVLRDLARTHRGGIRQIPAAPGRSREAYQAAHEATVAALADPDAHVVYQATLLGDRFVGFADFLIRHDDGSWIVSDTKLARSETVSALLQVGSYADVLIRDGVPLAPFVRLILGNGDASDQPLSDVLPVTRRRRERLLHLLDRHQDSGEPVAWGAADVVACLRCDTCAAELAAREDVLLVAGVHSGQRTHLLAAGVETVGDLARRTDPVEGLSAERLTILSAQARLQHEAATGAIPFEVHAPGSLDAIPPPSEGDVFFDFEGDPLWQEPGASEIGLEYLFGAMTHDEGGERFTPFWAHDRAQEKQALVDFMTWLRARRERWPDLHVYHYADYERAALLRLAARHGTEEDAVDDLLRQGVLVDLYGVVRSAIRVGQGSYSIKKLEPLYMGDDLRDAEGVTAGADSIVEYHRYADAVLDGRDEEAAERIEDIRQYNEYDCLSTLRLRDWLLDRAAEHGVAPKARAVAEEQVSTPPPEIEVALRHLAGEAPAHERTPEQQAVAMLSATIRYTKREQKPYWWAHFERLSAARSDWIGGADIFHVEQTEVVTDWHQEGRKTPRRIVSLLGTFPSGSRSGEGQYVAIYEPPAPAGMEVEGRSRWVRAGVSARSIEEQADGRVLLQLEESQPRDGGPWDNLPIALGPSAPPLAKSLDAAVDALGRSVLAAQDGGPLTLPPHPGLDLLLRRPPRLTSGTLPRVVDGDYIRAVTDAVRALDHSYLAVQGPPGTGKTYVGARVIAHLVRDHGWRIGVVAQSHAAVENMLDEVVRAGIPADQVGKAPKDSGERPWTVLAKDGYAAFAADLSAEGRGYVLGGTAWDLTNPRRIAPGSLDLVVIDEAGQYSIAPTLACSTAGDRLLLLGDPQQLPQVSQGSHPEPVDASALGWLLGDAATIPAEYGYFLATTWRMHPDLTAAVSTLSYEGALHSRAEVTTKRSLAGVAPGLHVVPVPHEGRTTDSPEEAEAIVALIRDLAGRTWTTEKGEQHPLRPRDILVVTAYNHQVGTLTRALRDAGLDEVRVGTVDKFQGQQAPVAILSMVASSAHDISKGLGFLLSRHRLNVAISRGQHAAFIVMSPRLTEAAPRSVRELRALGAFIGLIDAARLCGAVQPSLTEPI